MNKRYGPIRVCGPIIWFGRPDVGTFRFNWYDLTSNLIFGLLVGSLTFVLAL